MRIATFVVMTLVAMTGARAGPFEDAVSAEQRGDHSTAFTLFKQLAEESNPKAQNELGTLFHFGWGIAQNDAEAVKWWRLAAEQGVAAAQDALGFAYYYGEGVSQNYADAAKWLQRAADQGVPNSQNKLGLMYEQGQGVIQDYVLAYMWFNLAAAQDVSFIQNRERVAAIMTAAQIAEGQKRARDWTRKR
ncbi:MAG TPA: tetratricopeptide repeat protein [Pseudolabrys sp.]|jgi:TPR repeat protein|nr:tetratricopeptide repeat protein [Pseudolabrys sp.]